MVPHSLAFKIRLQVVAQCDYIFNKAACHLLNDIPQEFFHCPVAIAAFQRNYFAEYLRLVQTIVCSLPK